MRRVRRTGAVPELAVRRFVHAQGLRFSLTVRSLPGTPDIVLSKYRTVVFVHGCYWHRHAGCHFASTPSTSVEFWLQKFSAYVA